MGGWRGRCDDGVVARKPLRQCIDRIPSLIQRIAVDALVDRAPFVERSIERRGKTAAIALLQIAEIARAFVECNRPVNGASRVQAGRQGHAIDAGTPSAQSRHGRI
jgi:hypothetical protein